ncbi:hypothetical protein CEUSTIGMA_g12357.t1 [Chlamydomonas eustigma]|uniref:Uncharacterized protein n=1 Tax=Chlamydomonas eustigma TaxID=1157962 RepID=A0A250XPG0_9CHLO|nr:hypothetical protein CEUSTIGMA_g12357.t1 [Chlamydomonas eustigma]|eukprot:GAX84936.1 hypothetical protein CEUSTIGMA_g12357.t1 [Chlamydomonas eustigma]
MALSGISTISQGSASVAEASVVFNFLSAAGYGMAVSEAALMLGMWFSCARKEVKPAIAAALKTTCTILFISALCFGPGLGIVNVVFAYGITTLDASNTSLALRKAASAVGLLLVTSLVSVIALSCWFLVEYRVRYKGVTAVVHAKGQMTLWYRLLNAGGLDYSDTQVIGGDHVNQAYHVSGDHVNKACMSVVIM